MTWLVELTGGHGQTSGYAALVLDVDNLVVYHVVLALIHAVPIRRCVESLCHVLDVEDFSIDEGFGPLCRRHVREAPVQISQTLGASPEFEVVQVWVHAPFSNLLQPAALGRFSSRSTRSQARKDS